MHCLYFVEESVDKLQILNRFQSILMHVYNPCDCLVSECDKRVNECRARPLQHAKCGESISLVEEIIIYIMGMGPVPKRFPLLIIT